MAKLVNSLVFTFTNYIKDAFSLSLIPSFPATGPRGQSPGKVRPRTGVDLRAAGVVRCTVKGNYNQKWKIIGYLHCTSVWYDLFRFCTSNLTCLTSDSPGYAFFFLQVRSFNYIFNLFWLTLSYSSLHPYLSHLWLTSLLLLKVRSFPRPSSMLLTSLS